MTEKEVLNQRDLFFLNIQKDLSFRVNLQLKRTQNESTLLNYAYGIQCIRQGPWREDNGKSIGFVWIQLNNY